MAGETEKLGEVIGKCWKDADYKARLLSDTATVLAEAGIPVPEGQTVKIVENTDTVTHLVLPTMPTPEELAEGDLDAVAGGALAARAPLTLRPSPGIWVNLKTKISWFCPPPPPH